jgi:hypothetical protein
VILPGCGELYGQLIGGHSAPPRQVQTGPVQAAIHFRNLAQARQMGWPMERPMDLMAEYGTEHHGLRSRLIFCYIFVLLHDLQTELI